VYYDTFRKAESMKSLAELFQKCLNANYISTEGGGDYAIEREVDGVYIYLEDSDGRTDWKTNLSFAPRVYKREGKAVFRAHRGFLRAFEEILPYIEPVIKEARNRRFTVVGYSHGGGLAALLFEHILFLRPELAGKVNGYGFGAPRVFFGGNRKKLRERFLDFTVIRNGKDIVTHLPPTALGFFHVGRVLSVGDKAKYSPVDAHRPENILSALGD